MGLSNQFRDFEKYSNISSEYDKDSEHPNNRPIILLMRLYKTIISDEKKSIIWIFTLVS